MRDALRLQLGLVILVAVLVVLLVVVVVVAVLAVLQRLVQVGPLHHVDAVVARLLRLGAGDDIGGHGVRGPLRTELIPQDVDAEAWPLDLRAMQHVVGSRLRLQLLPIAHAVDARSPDALRCLNLLALIFVLLFAALVDLLLLLLVVLIVGAVVQKVVLLQLGGLRPCRLFRLLAAAAALGGLFPLAGHLCGRGGRRRLP
mmetsp:Transcript_133534/g.386527  ORF Transcript_133534/g.386527 Transcript_133534/m.386527 type:complete len:200 (-) Transcript_133534:51-650(-)